MSRISAATQVIEKPRQLKGQFLIWATAEGHRTIYDGGAFRDGLIGGWMTIMGLLTRGTSALKTLPEIKENEMFGEWWAPIDGANYYKDVDARVIYHCRSSPSCPPVVCV